MAIRHLTIHELAPTAFLARKACRQATLCVHRIILPQMHAGAMRHVGFATVRYGYTVSLLGDKGRNVRDLRRDSNGLRIREKIAEGGFGCGIPCQNGGIQINRFEERAFRESIGFNSLNRFRNAYTIYVVGVVEGKCLYGGKSLRQRQRGQSGKSAEGVLTDRCQSLRQVTLIQKCQFRKGVSAYMSYTLRHDPALQIVPILLVPGGVSLGKVIFHRAITLDNKGIIACLILAHIGHDASVSIN